MALDPTRRPDFPPVIVGLADACYRELAQAGVDVVAFGLQNALDTTNPEEQRVKFSCLWEFVRGWQRTLFDLRQIAGH